MWKTTNTRKANKVYKPFHVEVTADECGGNIDVMIKKFNKRIKKTSLVETVMEKKFFKSKSKIRHENEMRAKKIREIEKKHPVVERKDRDE